MVAKKPIIIIVGETASGKSALAIEIAMRFNGEIISADSRTIYKGMNIGTAKSSKHDQQRVRHHLLDIVEPDQSFSAAQFKQLAEEAVVDIQSRGKVPIMVGGTGLYIDSVLFDYQFSPEGAARDEQNPRHLKKTEPALRPEVRPGAFVVGMTLEREELKYRVHQRVQKMLEQGLVGEIEDLVSRYGWGAPGLQTIGYKEFRDNDSEHFASEIERNTLLYAKRQRTWFKRNKSIHWAKNPLQAVELITTFLNTRN